ncbi:MAG: TIGR01777 family oxidoreductase [Proteobacteria bacterium]|nr:TIGR01777 family oxidoreductase [Pseudomonadota bacterium]
MNILIAGGTGFIGQALVSHFLAGGHHVIVVSRDSQKVIQIFSDTVKFMAWEQLNCYQTKDVDMVVNLAGANIGSKKWNQNRREEIIASRIKNTHRIVDFCINNTVPLLINASAVGVYDAIAPENLNQKIYDENSAIEFSFAPNFLAKVAREWEMATWPARDHGLRVVNARFGVVLGAQGGMLQKLLPSFKLGLGAKIGSGRQLLSWVSLHDVIRAIQFIIDTPTIHGPINIVSPQIVTQGEFAHILASVLHRPRWITLSEFAIKCLFGNRGEELLLKGIAVKPSKLLGQGFKFVDDDLRQTLTRLTAKVSEPRYILLKKDGPIEIREYGEMVVAEVEVQGERFIAINNGFRQLANYIFGSNQKRQKIPMTAPVIQQNQNTSSSQWIVRFVMPEGLALDKLPKSEDPSIKLTQLAKNKYILIVFSGCNTDKNLQKYLQVLLAYIKKNDLKVNNEPMMAFYDPPWVLPFLRRNEIWFELLALQ